MPDIVSFIFFFFNDTATTEIYTLSLHDALPIAIFRSSPRAAAEQQTMPPTRSWRSEEHTSELQSRVELVCRLLLETKKRERCARSGEASARVRASPRAGCAARTRPWRRRRRSNTAACRAAAASSLFVFNDSAPTEIYTLSLHDALPI